MFQSDKELPVVEAPATKHYCLSNWRHIVQTAEARCGFSEMERTRAMDWNYCACGEAKARYYIEYETGDYPRPTDPVLLNLGGQFAVFVATNEFDACRATLDLIEERLEELDPCKP